MITREPNAPVKMHVLPPGRERALVVTKLQEAAFWAKRAVAIVPTNQINSGDTP